MRSSQVGLTTAIFLLLLSALATGQCLAQQIPLETFVATPILRSDTRPFHLDAVINDLGNPDYRTTVQLDWVSPTKYRRVIQAPDFSQTRIVNGSQVQETNSDTYFPSPSETLVNSILDPEWAYRLLQPDDIVVPAGDGFRDIIEASGHAIFYASDYILFQDRWTATSVTYMRGMGVSRFRAHITDLHNVAHPPESLFIVNHPTPPSQQLRSAFLSEAALRRLLLNPARIIWPQVINHPAGRESFYLAIDPTGRVREIHPLVIVDEHIDDAAISQMMQWRFQPAKLEGLPAQAEGILTFDTGNPN